MGNQDDLMRYSALCTQAAAAHIERSTRFKVNNLRVLDARPTVQTFTIDIRHVLEVHAEAQDCPGAIRPGDDDVVVVDLDAYLQQVALQTQAERTRTATLDSLIATVEREAYAAIAKRTCIRTHPQRLFHTHTCAGCAGAGAVACDDCSGDGWATCTWCHGSGDTSCHSCQGAGVRTTTQTVRNSDGDTGTEICTEPCLACSGGQVTCSWCSGSGRKSCSSCHGSGRLTCSTCEGHGCLTRITTTRTYTHPRFHARYPDRTPRYVDAAVRKTGYAELGRHAQVELRELIDSRDEAAAEFVYACSMPFCELTAELMDCRSEWVLFGTDAQVFDAGGVLETLLLEDFDRLLAMSRSWVRWLPWFHITAQEALTPFLASALNQDIICADRAGMKPPSIREQIARSVSQDYIEETLDALHRAVQAAAHWSRAVWACVLVLLSLPFALVASAVLHLPAPSGILWPMGWLTLPFTLPGCLLAHWMSRRWLKRAGGTDAVAWAEHRRLLPGIWTFVAVVAAAAVLTGAAFNCWPLRIDADGESDARFVSFAAQ